MAAGLALLLLLAPLLVDDAHGAVAIEDTTRCVRWHRAVLTGPHDGALERARAHATTAAAAAAPVCVVQQRAGRTTVGDIPMALRVVVGLPVPTGLPRITTENSLS